VSRTDNRTLTRPKVSKAALHADRIPGQVLAPARPQGNSVRADYHAHPEAIPFGFVQAAAGKGIRARDGPHSLRQGKGYGRTQRRRQPFRHTRNIHSERPVERGFLASLGKALPVLSQGDPFRCRSPGVPGRPGMVPGDASCYCSPPARWRRSLVFASRAWFSSARSWSIRRL
jgi:hypothetical protein